MIYANGLKVDINEIARLTFMQGKEAHEMKVNAEIAVTFECLKQIRDTITNVIAQHETNLSNVAKSN